MRNNWDRKLEEFDEEPERARPVRKVRLFWIFLIFALILVNISGIFLALREHYYRHHFLQGTRVNGQDISGRTAEEVKNAMSAKLDDYTLTVFERDENGERVSESINGAEIALEMDFDRTLENALRAQTRLEWLKRRFRHTDANELTLSSSVKYNREAWKMKLASMKCMSEDFITSPSNAKISDYQPGEGYVIIPENYGNQPDKKRVRKLLSEAVLSLQSEVDLTAVEGIYEDPTVFASDPELIDRRDKLNRYATMEIVYTFGDQKEILDGDIIHTWIRTDDAGNVTVDTSHVAEYVATLRKKYDTIFRDREFMTSYGVAVTLEGGEDKGDYGWWMDYTTEEKELTEMILKGESGERKPVYFQTAAEYGEQDYGDTYVEVNLTAQHIFFYKNGVLMLESDCVSGNERRGNGTPEGVYGITYKERNATLVGENYSTPVSWWMPFNKNVGLHDATWRRKFGADINMSSGSHGCVNLPYTVARELYQMVESGTAVICYHLEGTESKETTEQTDEDIAQSAIDAIEAIGMVQKTEDCKKRIDRARQLYNGLNSTGRGYVYNYETLKSAEEEYRTLK